MKGETSVSKEREGGMGCVSILAPSPHIYRPRGVGGAPLAALGATNRVVTCGKEEWRPSSLQEKELSGRILKEYSGTHLEPPLPLHDKPTRGRATREAAK